MTSPTRQSPKTSDYVANSRASSILRTKKRIALGAGLPQGVADGALRDHVGDDEQAEEQDKGGGDNQLRGETAQSVVVNVCAGRAAGWAASLHNRASTVCADQVLAAHLVTPSGSGALAHLA